MTDLDAKMDRERAKLQKDGRILRYVGSIQKNAQKNTKAEVRLDSFSLEHPFGRLKGTDNMVIFRTSRYDTQPMIIQKPGTNPEVTTAGIFSDLLRLAGYLGARQ